ncbi:DUF134 domain-containing protein [Candidatus Parcubacteria bacterium]|nr:DUF134 domain-containing protein [Candidatus Parcubacteria bacterium]
MPRPKKKRRISFLPNIVYFKPRGVPLRQLGEVGLAFEELEAIRLADLEELGQTAAARKMGISQSTFARVLASAHRKISEALIRGKAIRVEGGDFVMSETPVRQLKCESCQHIFEVPFGTGERGIEMKCPKCGSDQVHRVDQAGHGFGRQPWGYRGTQEKHPKSA